MPPPPEEAPVPVDFVENIPVPTAWLGWVPDEPTDEKPDKGSNVVEPLAIDVVGEAVVVKVFGEVSKGLEVEVEVETVPPGSNPLVPEAVGND